MVVFICIYVLLRRFDDQISAVFGAQDPYNINAELVGGTAVRLRVSSPIIVSTNVYNNVIMALTCNNMEMLIGNPLTGSLIGSPLIRSPLTGSIIGSPLYV